MWILQGRRLAGALGLPAGQVRPFVALVDACYRAYLEKDASMIEINPLVLTNDGKLLALDAKMSIDDDALFRHKHEAELRDTAQEDVLEVAASGAGIASIPGACTPTEMMRAHHAGAPLIKLFPAPAAGPVWLSSVLGPLPFLKVVPTNGVDVDNLSDWLEAGAYGAGFAATLFPTQDLTPAGLDRIEARAHAIVSQICAPAVVDRAIADVG